MKSFAALDWTFSGPARRVTLEFPCETPEEARVLLRAEHEARKDKALEEIKAHPRMKQIGWAGDHVTPVMGPVPPWEDSRYPGSLCVGIPNVDAEVGVQVGSGMGETDRIYRIEAVPGGGTRAVRV